MTLPARRTTAGPIGLALAVVAILAVAALAPIAAPQAAGSKALNGTFRLTPGSYSAGKGHGTYFRMIYPGGKRYFPNPDSKAKDKTFILGVPGTDGGLATGRFQPGPNPSFDAKGNARANKIIKPGTFTAIRFSVATLKKDPQSKKVVAVTSARVSGRRLTVSVPGYTAEWNGQYFNQGAPKPDGSGSPATGAYNAKTRHFVLTWKSKVSGGAFGGFTGYWHLEGTFSPR